LSTLDPTTGDASPIADLTVTLETTNAGAAYDQNTQQYTFCASDSDLNPVLTTVNTNNGDVVAQVMLDDSLTILDLHYDEGLVELVATYLMNEVDPNRLFWGVLDFSSGLLTPIGQAEFPEDDWQFIYAAMNSQDDIYYAIVGESGDPPVAKQIWGVDCDENKIYSNASIDDAVIIGADYDPASGLLFCLMGNTSDPLFYDIATIDPARGSVLYLNDLDNLEEVYLSLLDSDNQIFYLTAILKTLELYLISIDLSTGDFLNQVAISDTWSGLQVLS